ncbi:MAG: terpene cyclase/mutase family protein [Gloeobacteraceae cyanobacterium ES-bin-144]|nr:terpene cyclase/mutase family protein [Verrucomicrobiales bacterium]
MKRPITILLLTAALATAAPENPNRYESIRQEIRQAIARGNTWLKDQQKPEGMWDDGQLPAFTALALTAATRDPNLDRSKPFPEHIEKAYTWLIAQQKPDGGIYNRGLSVYNTATAVTALMAADRKDFEPTVVKARKHLIDNQWDIGQKKENDNPNDGGIGYGSKNDHTDLSNTYLAIEALALSKKVIEDGKHGAQPDLDWDAAVTFLSRCQNLEKTNDQTWASDDPKNKGGFIYTPGESKAGTEKTPDGRTALRSYGSMSYAGLLSFIYAKLSADDPRVIAVIEWLGKNYTLDENPGMGSEGLYYYYQTMSKALSAANINQLKLGNGKEADWRNELAQRILTKQRENGSWVNDNGRWMESNPVLVTAYTVLSLEQIYDSIPEK